MKQIIFNKGTKGEKFYKKVSDKAKEIRLKHCRLSCEKCIYAIDNYCLLNCLINSFQGEVDE